MFVSNQKIRSINLGPITQIMLFSALLWATDLFYKFVKHDKIVQEKSEEIEKLKAANSYFSQQFEDLNYKIGKIDNYFSSTAGGTKKASSSDIDSHELLEQNFDDDSLKGEDLQTFRYIRNSNIKIAKISESLSKRNELIELALAKTGLNIKDSNFFKKNRHSVSVNKPTDSKNNKNPVGGPIVSYTELDSALVKKLKNYSKVKEGKIPVIEFSNQLERLTKLENLVRQLPFEKPIRSFYLSSGFGIRRDPITGRHHAHQGLDFVGSKGAKIYTPASGVVILAHWFSDYGNAVVIDHGNGITTRYGHLSKIVVSEGQKVKKGDLIAAQGNTGRSTGPHLHYEIRYKNRPLNPKNFIEAGNILKNRRSNYANS